jgi:hypothetical protein
VIPGGTEAALTFEDRMGLLHDGIALAMLIGGGWCLYSAFKDWRKNV